MPGRWTTLVNHAQNEKELAALHRARDRGQPYGQDRSVQRIASALGLESSLRPPDSPKKIRKKRKTVLCPLSISSSLFISDLLGSTNHLLLRNDRDMRMQSSKGSSAKKPARSC
jgi:hypothetical protein